MSPYTIAGSVIGGLLCVAYLIVTSCRKKAAELSVAVEILISSLGLTSGLKVMVLAFSGGFDSLVHANPPKVSDEDIWLIVLGGFALLWVSVVTIWRALREK